MDYVILDPHEREFMLDKIHGWYNLSAQKSAYLDLMTDVDRILSEVRFAIMAENTIQRAQGLVDKALSEWSARNSSCPHLQDRSRFWIKLSRKEWQEPELLFVERSSELQYLATGTCYGTNLVDAQKWPDNVISKAYYEIKARGV
ncbi:hypothetical protein pEaSNUABM25_00041 [Erwinia phage pEa_SNUABM_25]|nr:hypothetical protein pEaSNUABM25_00041 [Erwinia phage pEa_SNUABM_25]